MWEQAVPAEPADGGFASLHPAVTISFFVLVIGLSVFVPHPLVLACSLTGALLLCGRLRGALHTLKLLAGLLPLALFAAAINALFNHQGVTILGYLGANPVTRESLLYGGALAGMLCAVLLWFSCYNQVVTSEKFLAVFGRIIPSLALVISMALRFVPRYLRQLGAISAARGEKGTGRFSHSFAALQILTSWALESALDTADSMHARGYGLPGRSFFAPFRFVARDALALALMLACAGVVVVALATRAVSVQYLPSFLVRQNLAGVVAFALLCLLPLTFELQEEAAWRISRSSI